MLIDNLKANRDVSPDGHPNTKIQMIIKPLAKLFLPLVASLVITSGSYAKESDAVTVRFDADTVRVLRNPLQGWVMYLGRTWDENFWQERGYDSMRAAGMDKPVRVSDYASCAYVRTSWASFEPEEGKYAWNDPDSRLMRLVRSVQARGLRIAFRIVVDAIMRQFPGIV